jgi:NAD(P)-dependent dehydrogenase (short-subunit alcohol dehydrogenase family)
MDERIASGVYVHWRQRAETNLRGTIKMARAATSVMRAAGRRSRHDSDVGHEDGAAGGRRDRCASNAMLYNATRKLAS